MTPLRLFYGIYVLTLLATMLTALVAVDQVRYPAVALGGLLDVFGACLVGDFFCFASETAANAAKSRWSPPAFSSVPLTRAMGVFFMLVGFVFATQALFAAGFSSQPVAFMTGKRSATWRVGHYLSLVSDKPQPSVGSGAWWRVVLAVGVGVTGLLMVLDLL